MLLRLMPPQRSRVLTVEDAGLTMFVYMPVALVLLRPRCRKFGCWFCPSHFRCAEVVSQLLQLVLGDMSASVLTMRFQVHYLTLQSNIGKGTDLEWQITNINDVIKPTFSYYFSRFGH